MCWFRPLRMPLSALAVAGGVGLVGAGGMLPSGPAVARTPIAEMLCSMRSSMEQRLSVQFRAQRTAIGIRDADSVLEVWTEAATGDWTMVVTYASGTSCIVAMGSAWEMQGTSSGPTDAG